jgi:hypothetical protein
MIHPAGLGPNEESIGSPPACSIFQDTSFQDPINFSLTDIAERQLVRARPHHDLCWTNSISARVIGLFIFLSSARLGLGLSVIVVPMFALLDPNKESVIAHDRFGPGRLCLWAGPNKESIIAHNRFDRGRPYENIS